MVDMDCVWNISCLQNFHKHLLLTVPIRITSPALKRHKKTLTCCEGLLFKAKADAYLVENSGFETLTSCLPGKRSTKHN